MDARFIYTLCIIVHFAIATSLFCIWFLMVQNESDDDTETPSYAFTGATIVGFISSMLWELTFMWKLIDCIIITPILILIYVIKNRKDQFTHDTN